MPLLTGKTYSRGGSILTGKMVIYPIIDNVEGRATSSSTGWAEIKRGGHENNDRNQTGNLADFHRSNRIGASLGSSWRNYPPDFINIKGRGTGGRPVWSRT